MGSPLPGKCDFPIFPLLGRFLRQSGNLHKRRVAWHCHLTWQTAMALDCLCQAEIEVLLSECNPETSNLQAIALMKAKGARVFTGRESTGQVLALSPDVLSDTGFVLIDKYLQGPHFPLFGGCEITTSGITRLRAQASLPLPVVNINGGILKQAIENFHGVGEGLVEALPLLINESFSEKRVACLGYGQVGKGVCRHLKDQGASVTVVEIDPCRRLIAHYDGFAVCALEEALLQAEIVVLATGRRGVFGQSAWQYARDGLIVVNVGHSPDEIDMAAVRSLALGQKRINDYLEEFYVPSQSGAVRIYIACGASPANVVLLTGSPEPTLIHLATEILTWNYLAGPEGRHLPIGEIALPEAIEGQAAGLALEALGLK